MSASGGDVGVLGPTVLAGSEAPSRLLARLLAGLVAAGRDGAGVDLLESLVWPEGPPATARASLQNLVARARRRLGDAAVLWNGTRYQLGPEVRTDVDELLRMLATIDECRERGDVAAMLSAAERARALFRGEPFADLAPDAARAARRRLGELRDLLDETLAEALSQLGRHDEGVRAWRALVDQRPHHEGRWAHLLAALQAAGRRAEALEAYQEVRTRLLGDLGIEPGVTLTAAHRAVIDDRPVATATPPAPVAGDPVPRPAVAHELSAALDAARFVVLTGEAGIGKSTVAAGVADARDGALTLRIHCRESPWTALQPLEELLTALDPRVRRLDPPAGAAAARLIGGAGSTPRPAPMGLAADVTDAVVRALADQPATLVVEDAEHAGPTTWRVLDRLRAELPELRVLAVARDLDDLPSASVAGAREVPLGGLEAPELEELVGRLLRRRGQVAPLARWTGEVTGGNPLFAIELVRELDRSGAIRRGPGGISVPATLPVPHQLRQVIGHRLLELDLRTRRTLDVLAVLGDRADDATVLRLGADPTALAAAAERGIVVRDGDRWQFRHALLHSTTLELVPPGRRVELELVVAAVLDEQGAPAGIVAAHRLHAAEVDPLGAATAALRAAQEAIRLQAFDEAVIWAERGRDALAGEPAGVARLRVALAVEAAEARRLAGAPDHAGDLLAASEQALALDDPPLRRRALLSTLRLGACCQAGAEQRRAVELADRALALETDPAGRAMLHASASLTHSMVDAQECRSHFRAALDELETARLDDPAVLVEVLPYAYLGLGLPDDLELRSRSAERLAAAAERIGDPAAAFEAGHLTFSCALQRGDHGAMVAAHAAMSELAPRVADAGRRWALTYQDAALRQVAGDLDAAEEAAQAALEIGTTVAASRAVATWAAQLLELRRLQGRLGELAPVLEGFVADPAALPAWRAAAAYVFAGERPDDARRLVAELVDDLDVLPEDFARGAALLTLARAVITLGAGEHAGPVLDCLRPWAHLMSWQGTTTYGPYGEAVAALGELVGDEEAVAVGRSGAEAVVRGLPGAGYGAAV